MGGITWLTRKTARTSAHSGEEARALTRDSLPSVMMPTPGTGMPVAPRTAFAIADAYACIRVLADAAAGLPLVTYRKTDAGRERVEGRTHELLTRPGPGVTQSILVGQIVAQLATHGNSLLGKFRDNDGRIVRLAPLPPEFVEIERERATAEPLFWYTNPSTGKRLKLTTHDVIHVRTLAVDGLVGVSPVRECRIALGVADSLAKHAAAFFENNAIPSGILHVNGPVGDKQVEEFEGNWQEALRGLDKSHRIVALKGDVKFEALTLNPDDAQFLEQRSLSSQEVARIFRVPPSMIGAPTGDSFTYGNREADALNFVTYSLKPYLVAIEQAMNADRDMFVGPLYCEFLIDGLLRSDSEARAAFYTAALDKDTGWMTREEVRRLENLPPETDLPPAPKGVRDGD